MTLPIKIAEASALDLDKVMIVMKKAFDPRFGEAWTAAQCAGILSLPGSLLLIARSDDRTLGFALARSVADEGELLLIAVGPDHQRHGTGKSLVKKMIEHLVDNGVKKLHLEMRTDNPALAFYNSLGFQQVGLRRDYYRGSEGQLTDAATLSLEIDRF
jgi:[ribosomal protein S18]-alanine N-acetyltransferase